MGSAIGTYAIELSTLPVGGITIASPGATLLEAGTASVLSYVYSFAALTYNEVYTVDDPLHTVNILTALLEDSITCTYANYSGDLKWAVNTEDPNHGPIDVGTSPATFDDATGVFTVYSTNSAHVGNY